MKKIISLYIIFITINTFANIQSEISEMCLRSAEHISKAIPGSHASEVVSPLLFNDYDNLNKANFHDYSDYFLSNNPSPEYAHFNLLKGLRSTRYLVSNRTNSSIRSFDETLKTIQEIRSYLNEDNFKAIKLRRDSVLNLLEVKDNIFIKLGCYSTTIISQEKCTQAVKYLMTSVDNHDTELGDTLYPSIIEGYFSQASHNQVLKTAALHFLTLMKNYMQTNALPKKDVYQEIKHNLIQELKLNEKSASKWTLSLLEFFAARGASWFFNGITLDYNSSNSSIVSIFIITSAIQFFDKVTFKLTGKQFSIPKQINTSCYYAKPYHFWMAAYMTHDAINNGKFDKKSALRATHLMGVGYELGRVSDRIVKSTYDSLPLSKEEQFSPGANAARIDLVFNTLGAWFGAIHLDHDAEAKSVDTTPAFKKILKKSNVLPSRVNFFGMGFISEVDFYYYYAPHAHLNYVLSRL